MARREDKLREAATEAGERRRGHRLRRHRRVVLPLGDRGGGRRRSAGSTRSSTPLRSGRSRGSSTPTPRCGGACWTPTSWARRCSRPLRSRTCRRRAARAVYLSSVSASLTPPWPGLGAYAVSKAALDKLVEAWAGRAPRGRVHPARGGRLRRRRGRQPGPSSPRGGTPTWPASWCTLWIDRGYIAGSLIEVDDLVDAVRGVLRSGPTVSIPSLVVAPRPRPSALAAYFGAKR